LILILDHLAGLGIDELTLHAVAGLPIERIESNALRRGRGGIERDRT
jgi:hypothetical protein